MRPYPLRVGLLIALLAPGLQSFAQAPALRIDDDRIGISKAIPKVGDEVAFRVPVTNPTDQAQAGQLSLRCWTEKASKRFSQRSMCIKPSFS